LFIGIICIVSFVLFYKPLFGGNPLGLDALGHLSKISYLHQYPLADWDMSWYSGTLFLKLYAPLFYYLAAVFPNPIFGTNLICFLSILLCSFGIYFFVNYVTKNDKASLFSGLAFLSVLSISFYYLSVGNHPWIASLWTFPFSLYFLERYLRKREYKDFVIYSSIFVFGILTHVLVGFLIGVLMVVRVSFDGINLSAFKKTLVLGIVPVLISCFWFFPFLTYKNNFIKGYTGQIPSVIQLFGLNNELTWGNYSNAIGFLLLLFIFSLVFFRRFCHYRDARFFLVAVFVVGFIMFGGLGQNYPYGVEPVRFILPFSILLCVFVGIVIGKTKLFDTSLVVALLFSLLAISLVWNCFAINENYEKFAYYGEGSRYNTFQDIIRQGIPIENEFTNYRFATSKFVFAENINYFYPRFSQTSGYQDVGMLDSSKYYKMQDDIWNSNSVNDSIYWLDWFAVKYIEVESLSIDSAKKFRDDARFKEVTNYSGWYNFVLFEYGQPKQIISLVDFINDTSFGLEKTFEWERKHPDEAIIRYNSADGDDVVLFKEFYHESWGARDISSGENMPISKVGPGFMAVYPKIDSVGVIFYQKKTDKEIIGYALTSAGLILLLLVKGYHLLE